MSGASVGPVATLPGSTSACPDGMMCDNHEDQVATTRIQGETDSFGCEYFDLCASCAATLIEEIRRERAKPHLCDWCKQEKTDCRPHRDFEEGRGGPVYIVCADCRSLEARRVAADYGDYDD